MPVTELPMPSIDLVFAAAPIPLLIYWMTKKAPMPSAKALPLAALLAYAIQVAWFRTSISTIILDNGLA